MGLYGHGDLVTDAEAFEAFALKAEPRLRRAFIGERGIDGAGDATAEALAAAWEHWPDVEAMGNPLGYLYRVGQSRTRRRRTGSLPSVESLGAPEFEPMLVPALRELPRQQLTAVWLVHACHWRHSEAAEASHLVGSISW